ncbi:hemagglutinin repeat-containing protein [Rhizobium sp. CNPSo 3464]|nr:hemagglutinin repeat-containing protein [Rhizobium sp. CNPSo 3464]MDK4741395.1 hemagglutinin repeat-containing protein [Rhizobium sp. CNPSo 3464]
MSANNIDMAGAQATTDAFSRSESAGASIGGATGITPTASVSAGQSKSSSASTTQVISAVSASNNIKFVSKGDTTLNNTVFSADAIDGDVGGNLSIISTPNTGTQSNSSSSLGFSFTGGTIGKTDGQDLLTASNVGTALGGLTLGGVQPAFGSGKGSTNWIDTPAGLYSTGDQNITVGKNTNLTAAGMISTDGQVNLDTGTLTWSDFVGSQKYQGYQVNADIDLYGGKDANGITQNNSSAEGKYQLDDVEQSVKATISGSGGAGNITIRNPDQQAALEQSGQTGTPAQINTDPTQQNVVTKEKHIDLEPYVSVQSLQAAVNAGQTLIEAIGSAFDKMLADGKISPEENTSAHKILLNLKDPNVREAIANCAKQASGTACSGTGGLTSDMAQDILGTTRNAGKVTVVTSEDQVTITELTGMEEERDFPETPEERKAENELENGPRLDPEITSPSQVRLPQGLNWLDKTAGTTMDASGNLLRSAGTITTENGYEPVYEALGSSGQPTGSYVTLDSGGNSMAVGGNTLIDLFSTPGADTDLPELNVPFAFSIDDNQIGRKLAKHVSDFGGNPANPDDRSMVLTIIQSIVDAPDAEVSGTFMGQGPDGSRGAVKFFIKGNDVVVTKPNGEFVTVLKDGVNNTSVKNAIANGIK